MNTDPARTSYDDDNDEADAGVNCKAVTSAQQVFKCVVLVAENHGTTSSTCSLSWRKTTQSPVYSVAEISDIEHLPVSTTFSLMMCSTLQ